ncbi:SDR family NAD(P)-dependent oxidoreductase [Thermodesulfobacteriota bacterium]
MTSIKEIKRSVAKRYIKNNTVSRVQAFLKTSLVPLNTFDNELPQDGVILDLGCGEGILANLVSAIRPECNIIGIDLKSDRVDKAKKNALPNASFLNGDILDLSYDYRNLAAVILNDVVHHQYYRRHQTLIFNALNMLRPGGLLILKEVDQMDHADVSMTRFFDSRLYPNDPLCFRSENEWFDLLARLGADDIVVHHVQHPWPASRTVFFVRRPEKLIDPITSASQIGMENIALSKEKTIVFVTGATGFLGRHLCRNLLARNLDGKPVRLIYLVRNPHRNLDELYSTIPLYGDLNDLPELKDALRGVEFVFHLAAEVKLTKGVDIWRNNHQGTLSLLESLKEHPLKRFVYASTIGAVDRMPTDNCSQPLTENITPNPLSEYGQTKLAAEKAVQNSGIPYSILRVTWAFGPGMTPDTHVHFLTDGVARRKIFSRFEFPGKVSVLSATDTVEAFRLISTHKSAVNEIFFASDGHPLSLASLFRFYASVIGQRHRMVPLPSLMVRLLQRFRRFVPFQVQALASDVLTADPKKLFSLGFHPKIGVREGLIDLARDQGNLPPLDFDQPRHPVSIITGAASGIGNALARRMHDEGHSLLLIDKNIEKLRLVAESLDALFLELDLSHPESPIRLERYLESNCLYIDWMVNNAGIGVRGDLDSISLSRLRNIIDINCSAVVALSQLLIRQSKKSGIGMLINIGSSSGFQPLPFMAVYAASKSFVQSFTLAIMGEEVTEKSNISIMLIDPSGTDTNFQAAAGVKKNANENLLSPDDVAKIIMDSSYGGKREIIIGKSGQVMSIMARILPRMVQVRLWANLMSKLR